MFKANMYSSLLQEGREEPPFEKNIEGSPRSLQSFHSQEA